MGRIPTGKRPGRPKGSGLLGDVHKLAVLVPLDFYNRFAAFAEGQRDRRGGPQLSHCVREALEHYMQCPQRLTKKSVVTTGDPGAGIHPMEKGIEGTGAGVHPMETGIEGTGAGIHPMEKGIEGTGAGVHPMETGTGDPGADIHPMEKGIEGTGAGVHPMETGTGDPGADIHPMENGTATSVPQAKAVMLERIAAMHADGLALGTIAERLNQEGVPTFSGRGGWNRGTLSKLLRQAATRNTTSPQKRSGS